MAEPDRLHGVIPIAGARIRTQPACNVEARQGIGTVTGRQAIGEVDPDRQVVAPIARKGSSMIPYDMTIESGICI